MKQRKEADVSEPEINITPMLDIVFIMLIFFIVTATFVKEAGVDVERPEAVTTDIVPRVSVIIAVTANNEIWINKREVDIREVRAVVERLIRENPQGKVVITADKASQSGVVVDIMDTLTEIGVSGVSIAAPEKK
jgi:biopolymer transport protein ExbD